MVLCGFDTFVEGVHCVPGPIGEEIRECGHTVERNTYSAFPFEGCCEGATGWFTCLFWGVCFLIAFDEHPPRLSLKYAGCGLVVEPSILAGLADVLE